jgi:hypothetical protein
VFKTEQLKFGSSVYPCGHDALRILRTPGNRAHSIEPRARVPDTRRGVLDRAPGLRQGPSGSLRYTSATLHVRSVQPIGRGALAIDGRCGVQRASPGRRAGVARLVTTVHGTRPPLHCCCPIGRLPGASARRGCRHAGPIRGVSRKRPRSSRRSAHLGPPDASKCSLPGLSGTDQALTRPSAGRKPSCLKLHTHRDLYLSEFLYADLFPGGGLWRTAVDAAAT